MAYGYEPAQYIPDYSYVARAGQQIAAGIDKWGQHQTELEQIKNNKQDFDEIYKATKNHVVEELIRKGVDKDNAEKIAGGTLTAPLPMYYDKPLEYVKTIEGEKDNAFKNGDDWLKQQRAAQAQNAIRSPFAGAAAPLAANVEPVVTLPEAPASFPQVDPEAYKRETRFAGTSKAPTTQQEAYGRAESPEVAEAMTTLPEFKAMSADEATREKERLSLEKTQAEIEALNRKANTPAGLLTPYQEKSLEIANAGLDLRKDAASYARLKATSEQFAKDIAAKEKALKDVSDVESVELNPDLKRGGYENLPLKYRNNLTGYMQAMKLQKELPREIEALKGFKEEVDNAMFGRATSGTRSPVASTNPPASSADVTDTDRQQVKDYITVNGGDLSKYTPEDIDNYARQLKGNKQ